MKQHQETTFEQDTATTADAVQSHTRTRLSAFLLLIALAAQGCATTPRCRLEFFHNDEQAKYLKGEGCERDGKLTYKCCGGQAKDYDWRNDLE